MIPIPPRDTQALNPPKPPPRDPDPPGRTPALESDALFGDASEVVIRHNGRDYRLRKTRLGKLILTA